MFHRALFLLALGLSLCGFTRGPTPDTIASSLIPFYQDLHAHPELSFHEEETAAKLADRLRALAGLEVTTGIGKTGLVGVLRNGEGPTVLVRTELDALPVTERTGLPYASRVTARRKGHGVGVMHACGHDLHMATWVGTAQWLATHRAAWRGTVVFVGQPAEELTAGARRMLKDGLYDRFPKPDYALALHDSSDLAAGDIAFTPGPALASDTPVTIVVRGKGGHGAMPQLTVDPILLASLLVVDLQSVVSRESSPTEPVVVTVGTFQAGTKRNVIPDVAELGLTVRTLTPESTKRVIGAIRRHARGLAEAHGAPAPEITVGRTSPPLINDRALVFRVVPALRSALGVKHVIETGVTMASEDFGAFGEGGVPYFMFWLGAVNPQHLAEAQREGKTLPSLHSAEFAPDAEPALRTGIEAMTAAVSTLLPPEPEKTRAAGR